MAAAEEEAPSGFHIDLGHLLVVDPTDSGIEPSTSSDDYDQLCLQKGCRLIQSLAEQLFNLPSTPDINGRLVDLPPPTTKLPREKPLPKARPPTKWEAFAQKKGIKKRKRSAVEFDEQSGEWRRRHGYKKVNDEADIPVIEAKSSDVTGEDPFTKMRADKKDRVKKQEKNRLSNLKNTLKVSGKNALPSTVQLSTMAFPITGSSQPPKKLTRDELGEVAGIASTSTASIGKFDRKIEGEKPAKHAGKHRKFLPVVGSANEEKQQSDKILNKILSRADDVIDVNKAVGKFNNSEQRKREQEKVHGPNRRSFKRGSSAGQDKGKGKGKGGKGSGGHQQKPRGAPRSTKGGRH